MVFLATACSETAACIVACAALPLPLQSLVQQQVAMEAAELNMQPLHASAQQRWQM
jgi:hypothetical protein